MPAQRSEAQRGKPNGAATGVRARKRRDRAAVLTIVGTILLMPPIAGAMESELRLFGVPLAVVYVFSVWAALIVGTALLAPRLDEATSGRQL